MSGFYDLRDRKKHEQRECWSVVGPNPPCKQLYVRSCPWETSMESAGGEEGGGVGNSGTGLRTFGCLEPLALDSWTVKHRRRELRSIKAKYPRASVVAQ